MRLKPIAEILKENGLTYPALAVLQPNEQLYTALLVQPRAQIEVRDEFIRNQDRIDASQQYEKVALLAKQHGAELFVTPEYSFPWEVLERLLATGNGPADGQLWVIGCESLAIGELPTLKQRFGTWAHVLHEELPKEQPTTARYLDPLTYLFRTTDVDGKSCLAIVVQFKTSASGDGQNIEATRLAVGRDVYVFEKEPEVKLISLICSDVFAFKDVLVDACYENLLLIHVQLNEKPRNEDYMRYRRRLYAFDCDRTELICLNWAEKFEFSLGPGAPIAAKQNIGGSAWHSKSTKFATEDARIEHNHQRGLYYTRDAEQHRHMLHFSYLPAAFLIKATKVRHHAVEAAKSRRRGPEVDRVFLWGKHEWQQVGTPLDDGFLALTAQYGFPATQLDASYKLSPLAAERISCIASGRLGPGKFWFESPFLPTTQLAGRTEVVRRVTVTQDPEGKDFRDAILRSVKALANIPAAELPVQERLGDIRDGYQFNWDRTAPHCNIISGAGRRATLIYAGESPLPDDLSRIHDRALATLMSTTHAERLCVLYRDGQEVKRFDPPTARQITSTSPAPGKDFTEPRA
jgi:hypothetical protein